MAIDSISGGASRASNSGRSYSRSAQASASAEEAPTHSETDPSYPAPTSLPVSGNPKLKFNMRMFIAAHKRQLSVLHSHTSNVLTQTGV